MLPHMSVVAPRRPQDETAPVQVFCCVAEEDRAALSELDKHLASLEHVGQVALWHRGKVQPGDDKERQEEAARARAEIVLLLISASFVSDKRCLALALDFMARLNSGGPQLIPIRLKPVNYEALPLYGLKALPERPVSAYQGDEDRAWAEISRGLGQLVKTVRARRSAPLHFPEAGTTIKGQRDRYLLKEQLGRGGYGVVYRAKLYDDEPLAGGEPREVAIKLFAELWTHGPAQWLHNEVQALYKLTHENIVRVNSVDRWTDDAGRSHPFIVMEYLDGRTLEGTLNAGRLSLGTALSILQKVCRGVEAAHRNDVIHRDLKPANLMLLGEEPDYQVKLLDFGLSKPQPAGTDQPSGHGGGTPGYQSPEQASGQPVDGRSDIYSIGCILHRILVGRPPALTAPAELSAYEAIPPGVCALCLRATQRDPAARYQTVRELSERLRELRRGLPAQELGLLVPLLESDGSIPDTVQATGVLGWVTSSSDEDVAPETEKATEHPTQPDIQEEPLKPETPEAVPLVMPLAGAAGCAEPTAALDGERPAVSGRSEDAVLPMPRQVAAKNPQSQRWLLLLGLMAGVAGAVGVLVYRQHQAMVEQEGQAAVERERQAAAAREYQAGVEQERQAAAEWLRRVAALLPPPPDMPRPSVPDMSPPMAERTVRTKDREPQERRLGPHVAEAPVPRTEDQLMLKSGDKKEKELKKNQRFIDVKSNSKDESAATKENHQERPATADKEASQPTGGRPDGVLLDEGRSACKAAASGSNEKRALAKKLLDEIKDEGMKKLLRTSCRHLSVDL